MRSGSALTFAIGVMFVGAVHAEQTATPSSKSPTSFELTGCISGHPAASGSFTFTDSTSGSAYKLTGKTVRKYAGKMVRLVGGPQGKRLSVAGGLWPSANIAGQQGGLDPAQESIARQPGGGGSAAGANNLPEFRVVAVSGLDGACR